MPYRRAELSCIHAFIAALALTLSLGFALVSPPSSAQAQTPAPVRIMALGDSITTHSDIYNSYRRPLWYGLRNAGYSVDFTGSRQVNDQNVRPPNPDFDLDHEGHPGWRVDNSLGNIRAWADAQRPNIVLIHLGTNDLFQGQSVDSTVNELGQLIDTLRASNANVTILMTQIIPHNRSTNSLVPTLNNQIASLVSSKNTAQSRVIVVDQYSNFNVTTDTYDGVHPNVAGEQKLADRWYQALQTVLSSTGTQPTPTRTPTFPPTTTPGGTNNSLYRAINLAGSAVAIDGEAWEAETTAANFTATADGGRNCWAAGPYNGMAASADRFECLSRPANLHSLRLAGRCVVG